MDTRSINMLSVPVSGTSFRVDSCCTLALPVATPSRASSANAIGLALICGVVMKVAQAVFQRGVLA